MTPPDDRDLLRSVAGGDRDAFAAFVERHQAAVFRFLVSRSEHDADAEDALQETFLAAWRSAGTYRGGASARAWILTVARNAWLKARRLRAGEPSRFEGLDELGLRAGWGDRPGALDDLANREILGLALGRMDPEHREVLVLRELEGLPGGEVAEVLGLSLAAMKSRLHRARLEFVAHLREVADVRA